MLFLAEITRSVIEEKGPQTMNEGIRKLKQRFNENPVQIIALGTGLLYAVAKVIDATSAAQGRRAYAQQVELSKIRAGH